MAQRNYTVPLNSVNFPLLSEDHSRTVIVGGGSKDSGNSDASGNPQLYYCHNVMPVLEGYRSIGYRSHVPAVSPAVTTFSDTRIIYGSDRTRIELTFNTDGTIYSAKEGEHVWRLLASTAPVPASDITTGTVNGVTYIFYKETGCYIYNETTNTLVPTALDGLTENLLIGITASSGYLIAYTQTDMAWSSVIDPTDFVPSQVTGAGGGSISGLGGAIVLATTNSLGVLFHTDANTVAATYTGNAQYPFKLREVDNSKGASALDLIAYEANSVIQFSYSKAGLQSISSKTAENILPEVTDFLGGGRIEDFDETTGIFTATDLTTTLKKKVKFVASRYLVISYGETEFTHALVYDVTLKRLGKLKVTHVDCFEHVGGQIESSKESISFMLSTGETKLVEFSPTYAASNGVAVIGKLQYARSRLFTLEEVELETIDSGATLSVSTLVSLDGKTHTKVDGSVLYSAEGVRRYGFLSTGVNHSILIAGKFKLTACIIKFILNGRR